MKIRIDLVFRYVQEFHFMSLINVQIHDHTFVILQRIDQILVYQYTGSLNMVESYYHWELNPHVSKLTGTLLGNIIMTPFALQLRKRLLIVQPH